MENGFTPHHLAASLSRFNLHSQCSQEKMGSEFVSSGSAAETPWLVPGTALTAAQLLQSETIINQPLCALGTEHQP